MFEGKKKNEKKKEETRYEKQRGMGQNGVTRNTGRNNRFETRVHVRIKFNKKNSYSAYLVKVSLR